MRYRVLPYRQGSASSKALASALGGKVLKLEGSSYKPSPGDRLIVWGNTQSLEGSALANAIMFMDEFKHFNLPVDIKQVSNKLHFFKLMKAEHADIIPEFWTNQGDIPDDAFPIVCRTILAGHSGAGIVIAENRDGLVNAPLYVKYLKKKDEYRVHIGRRAGADTIEVIAVQRKARRLDHASPNWQVRNHANGFNFIRDGVSPPNCVVDSARRALEVSGLDFGAIDVIYNENSGRAYVLEINTAPGLEGQTIEDYATFFKGV